jgi:hypothetical protein
MDNAFGGLQLHGPIGLASSEAGCWKCHRTTVVHSLLATDVTDVNEGDDTESLGSAAFVYEVDQDDLPAELVAALKTAAPNYVPTYSRTTGQTCWANRCSHCGVLQGAFFIHSEPDGPFFGGPDEFRGETQALYNADVLLASGAYSF